MKALLAVLQDLSPREEKVLRLRFGLLEERTASVHDVADRMGLRSRSVARIEARVLRKLRQPSFSRKLKLVKLTEEVVLPLEDPSYFEAQSIIEQIRVLTPGLMSHLRGHSEDITRVRWEVFEHFVAELLASLGFEHVSLVGKDSKTSADIFAAWKLGPLSTRIRIFIEVKRWKDKIGVGVIDHVFGAMFSERDKFGWHAAWIVSIRGYRDFKKYTREALTMRGIELKDRDDLCRWLDSYEPRAGGLWLPKPTQGIPSL